MRTVALTIASFVAFSCAANAQKFTLLPQVGFENSKTVISYNDVNCFSPLGVKFSPQASIRLNYSSKQGHGFFVGAATSRSITSFTVSDLENGMNNYAATTGNMQVRLEGGYQFNTKPIYFSKAKQAAPKKEAYSGCGASKTKAGTSKANRSWVRIQPSVGIGFIPSVKTDVVTKTQAGPTSYEYRAGNWSTALITGAGFEFGRNRTRLFTVSVNYFNGLSNLDKQTISVVEGPKTTTTTLQSDASGWNVRVGIPFTLGKAPSVKSKKDKVEKVQRCGQYRIYRCTRAI